MLQGHIDDISDGQISGWVYSRLQPVAGEQILAYCGEQCIGAGEIGIFRADLRDAGLDDGRLGFRIRFDQNVLSTGQPIHLRFDSSDFSLHPTAFWKRPAARPSNRLGLYSQAELDRLDWMAGQGWLTQDQYAMARSLNRMGVYQRTFSRAELVHAPLETLVHRIYAECLSILFKISSDAAANRVRVASHEAGAALEPGSGGGTGEIFGIYATAFRCGIAEGVQRTDVAVAAEVPVMQYQNSAFQLMLVHAACLRGAVEPEGAPNVLYVVD